MISNYMHLVTATSSLTVRMEKIHQKMLDSVPGINRITSTIYNPQKDVLKSFINSSKYSIPFNDYEIKLSDVDLLSNLAASKDAKVIDCNQDKLHLSGRYSDCMPVGGYHSSFISPMYDDEKLLGFLFYDSVEPATFTTKIRDDLILYSHLISMVLSAEFAAVNSLVASVGMARDFSNLRNLETGAHMERVAQYSRLIANGVAHRYGLTNEFIEHLALFAPLHDIGKIGIPDEVLLKQGKLNSDELLMMQSHVVKGIEFVEKNWIDCNLHQSDGLKVMLNIVASHHEYIDGSGYPKGLKGDEVPIEARIVTIADILDALLSNRPYKPSWSIDDAINELIRMAKLGKLDAHCVDVVSKHRLEIEKIFHLK